MPDERKEVRIEEIVMSLTYQMEALIRLLDRKGIVYREEVIAEIEALKIGQAKQR